MTVLIVLSLLLLAVIALACVVLDQRATIRDLGANCMAWETTAAQFRMEKTRLEATVRNYDWAWSMRPGQVLPIDDAAREKGFPRMMTVSAGTLEREVSIRRKIREGFNDGSSGSTAEWHEPSGQETSADVSPQAK